MPEPREKETRREYVSRCIQHYMKKGLTANQAGGKCHGMWRQAKKGKKV